MEHFSIPGLRQVAAIPFDALTPDIRRMRIAGMTAQVSAIPTMMYIFGESSLEWEIGADGKRSASLSFYSLESLPNSPFAFVAEDRMGIRWLVGAMEPPFPVVSVSATSGKGSADSRAILYKVEWEGTPIICNCRFPSDISLPLR